MTPSSNRKASHNTRTKSARRRRKHKDKPRRSAPEGKLPVSVVTREGKTTTRQFDGRRFVRFGEFRGKRVSWVEFYTCGTEYSSISIRFQDRTVVYFKINPMLTVKPQYYRFRAGDLETVKEWPEIRSER